MAANTGKEGWWARLLDGSGVNREVHARSNPDAGPDDRNRNDDDQRVDREPLRDTGHSLVLRRHCVPDEGGPTLTSSHTRYKKISSSVAYRAPIFSN
jgi:hypothetical protein